MIFSNFVNIKKEHMKSKILFLTALFTINFGFAQVASRDSVVTTIDSTKIILNFSIIL